MLFLGYSSKIIMIYIFQLNNIVPESLAGPKALDPNHCRQPNLLITQPFNGGRNCAWYWDAPVLGKDIPPIQTNNIEHLTYIAAVGTTFYNFL